MRYILKALVSLGISACIILLLARDLEEKIQKYGLMRNEKIYKATIDVLMDVDYKWKLCSILSSFFVFLSVVYFVLFIINLF